MQFFPRTPASRSAALAAALIGSCASGCSCEEDRPYTPFSVATQLPESEKPPQKEEPPAPEPAPRADVARAPAATKTWTVFRRTLAAPPGGTFVVAAQIPPIHADAEATVVAWVTGPPAAAGLWLFASTGQPTQQLARRPEFLPEGDDCTARVELQPSGRSTVAVDVLHDCKTRQLPGAATRALLVIDLAANQPLVHGLRVAEPAPGEELELLVDGADLDGDGTDDVSVRFELQAPGGTKEHFSIHWLTRPAGSSRQKDTPGRELTQRTGELTISSQRKAERGRVPAQVNALRRLFASVCSEGGAPRISQWDGTGLSCGSVDAALVRLNWAAVQAHLGLKEPARALGEIERASWYGKGPNDKERSALEALFLGRIATGTPRKVADVRARLGTLPPGVSRSRLAFNEQGQLFGRDDEGTHLLWPAAEFGSGGAAGLESLSPWALQPEGPGGKRVLAVLPSCERSEVQVAFADSSGAALPTVALPLLAPRPGQCKQWGGGPLPAHMLGWVSGQPLLAVGSEIFHPGDNRPRTGALSSSLGFAVETEAQFELWRAPYFRPGLECATTGDHKLAACWSNELVTIWERPESFQTAAQ